MLDRRRGEFIDAEFLPDLLHVDLAGVQRNRFGLGATGGARLGLSRSLTGSGERQEEGKSGNEQPARGGIHGHPFSLKARAFASGKSHFLAADEDFPSKRCLRISHLTDIACPPSSGPSASARTKRSNQSMQ